MSDGRRALGRASWTGVVEDSRVEKHDSKVDFGPATCLRYMPSFEAKGVSSAPSSQGLS